MSTNNEIYATRPKTGHQYSDNLTGLAMVVENLGVKSNITDYAWRLGQDVEHAFSTAFFGFAFDTKDNIDIYLFYVEDHEVPIPHNFLFDSENDYANYDPYVADSIQQRISNALNKVRILNEKNEEVNSYVDKLQFKIDVLKALGKPFDKIQAVKNKILGSYNSAIISWKARITELENLIKTIDARYLETVQKVLIFRTTVKDIGELYRTNVPGVLVHYGMEPIYMVNIPDNVGKKLEKNISSEVKEIKDPSLFAEYNDDSGEVVTFEGFAETTFMMENSASYNAVLTLNGRVITANYKQFEWLRKHLNPDTFVMRKYQDFPLIKFVKDGKMIALIKGQFLTS